jgi:glycosyltransferase involved in cell wall biosynthesis
LKRKSKGVKINTDKKEIFDVISIITKMHKLSVVIITLNEEENIGRCLASVRAIADEIVVVDGLSKDKTVEICNAFGCKVISREFKGFSDQKQFAVDQARNDWVFVLDADEEVTEELRSEISGLLSKDQIPCNGYKTPRALYYLGRVLRYSGVGEKPVLRIFNKRVGKFNSAPVHEEIIVEGPIGILKHRMIHYSYRDLSHHLQKTDVYTSHAASGYVKRGKHFPKPWVAFKFPVTFITYYFFRGGFLDGYPGFMWSFFAAFYGSLKLAKAIEMEERNVKNGSSHV